MLIVSEAWKTTYPGAVAGVLVMSNVSNAEYHSEFDRYKDELENQLRFRFADRDALKSVRAIQAYNAYFKPFKKTYPVLLQLESVALKRKPIPRVAALVEAMFMAELKNMLLTAGHNLEAIQKPVRLDVAKGTERYVKLNGQEQQLKAGDMMMTDAEGIISSVLYGPDYRTRIIPDIRRVFFAVYAPPGIGEQRVYQHLQDIHTNVRLVSPDAEVEEMKAYVTE